MEFGFANYDSECHIGISLRYICNLTHFNDTLIVTDYGDMFPQTTGFGHAVS